MAVAQVHLPHVGRHRTQADSATAARPVPSLGHTIAVWVTLMTIGFVGGLTVIVWAVTGSFIIGLGVATFCAVWGGPGFGIMAGSAAHAMQTERAERELAHHAA